VLLDAARTLEPLDPRLARDTYAEALEAVLISAQLTIDTTPAEIARAALAAPPVPDETFADVMLEAFATLFTSGYVAAVPILRRGVALAATEGAMVGMTRGATVGQIAAATLWDVDCYGAMLHALEPLQRERGALDNLRITLGGLGYYNVWSGRLALAEAHRSESVEITRVLGENPRVWELLNCELFAYQGRDADTRAATAALTSDRMVASGAGVSVNQAHLALVILELSQGHYAEAFEPAWKLYESDAQRYGNQTLAEIVEAGVRSGQQDAAIAACARLEERAEASSSAWALGLLARSRALLATDVEAGHYYTDAIELLGSTVVKTDLARAHLLYGEFLRERKRPQTASAHLAIALEMFEAMGAVLFAERARVELAATGVTPRRREASSDQELTGQEHQVAQLAAAGATNNEIAATMFISAATVEYHLRKVYRKLGIASRRQLQSVLPD
jgi:DNA-binding CsgD family transcriptional regulator